MRGLRSVGFTEAWSLASPIRWKVCRTSPLSQIFGRAGRELDCLPLAESLNEVVVDQLQREPDLDASSETSNHQLAILVLRHDPLLVEWLDPSPIDRQQRYPRTQDLDVAEISNQTITPGKRPKAMSDQAAWTPDQYSAAKHCRAHSDREKEQDPQGPETIPKVFFPKPSSPMYPKYATATAAADMSQDSSGCHQRTVTITTSLERLLVLATTFSEPFPQQSPDSAAGCRVAAESNPRRGKAGPSA